jgi:hypothetical protein
VVLSLTVLLLGTLALPAAAGEDPFSGKWRGIDADYSHWKMTITAGEHPGEYVLTGKDNKNTNCDNKPAVFYGTAEEDLVQANPEGTLFLPGLTWTVRRDCVTVDEPSGGGVVGLWLEDDGTLWINQGPNFRLACWHRNNDPHACPRLDENDFGW